MEIREQINKLSKNPIFFMSPNIGIKFNIIKAYPEVMNKKYKKILDSVINENANYDYTKEKKLDNNLLMQMIFAYLSTQKSKFIKTANLDSLIENLDKKDSFFANAFLAYYYYDNNNYERTEPYLKFALKYIENNEVSDYERMCIYALTADFLSKTQDIFISGAEKYFIQALNLIGEDDALGKISLLNSLAYYYHNIEKRDKAIEYINIALEMIKKYTFSISSFTTYKNAGIIYTTIGDFEKAKLNFTKATDFSKELVDNIEENVKLLNTLGYVEFLKGDFEDSFNSFEKALMLLITYKNTTKLLDEAVKTFDNFGNILKFLGDIDSSIDMQLLGKEILEKVNFMNRVNEVHNLSKIYTDIALTYLLYKSDYKTAESYYNLAQVKTDENEHYIKRNKKIILENLINLNKTWNLENENSFYEAIEKLKANGEDNLYVQLILIEFLIYYYKLKKDEKLLHEAFDIAKTHNLQKHYENISDIILEKKSFKKESIDFEKYPINLIMLLAREKRELLLESKKSKHLELIEEFMVEISRADREDKLFRNSENILNKHFFSKGFLVIEKQKKHFAIKYFNETNKKLIFEHEDFFINEIKKVEKQEILNFDETILIKSCMIEKVDYKEEGLVCYFILFNDRKNDWNFNAEELKTFGILINNLYLKHKNIMQLKKIELNAITDYMTGFKNASYYNEAIKILIKNYNLTKEVFAMAIIDLNKFKKINDTYGHDVGDKTLRYFAKSIESKINGVFDFIRYGGDEFILLFDGKTDMENEFLKIKKHFSAHPLTVENEKIFVEFSYGIEIYDGQSESDFFKITDNKMYKQKLENKKDQV